jgi:hypothetical protein
MKRLNLNELPPVEDLIKAVDPQDQYRVVGGLSCRFCGGRLVCEF